MKTRSWSSASWYRVAGFRPRLRTHVKIHRHVYRGKLWFVLQDRTSGRFHRFTPEAYRLIAMMDGHRTLEQIWEDAVDALEIDAVTQDELVRLVGQLYSADVLSGDVPPDIMELSERGRRTARQKLIKSVMNPLALRVPVFDPDDFLEATIPIVRPFLSWFGALLWLGVVATTRSASAAAASGSRAPRSRAAREARRARVRGMAAPRGGAPGGRRRGTRRRARRSGCSRSARR